MKKRLTPLHLFSLFKTESICGSLRQIDKVSKRERERNRERKGQGRADLTGANAKGLTARVYGKPQCTAQAVLFLDTHGSGHLEPNDGHRVSLR